MEQDPTNIVGRRTAAFIIDLLIIWGVAAILFFALAEKNPLFVESNHLQVKSGDTLYVVQGGSVWIFWGVLAFVLIDIAVILEGLTGVTPGKALLGVRVVDEQGGRPGMGRAFLRLILWVVDGFFCYLVAFVTALTSKRHQRVGDMAAKTFVVRNADAGRPIPAAPGSVVAPVTPGPAPVTPAPATGGERDAFGRPVAAQPQAPVSASPAPAPAPTPAAGLPRADWYPDPTGQARLRYWDGRSWTDNTAP